jgi:hypothetical protein
MNTSESVSNSNGFFGAAGVQCLLHAAAVAAPSRRVPTELVTVQTSSFQTPTKSLR